MSDEKVKRLRPKYEVRRINEDMPGNLGEIMDSTDPDNIDSPFVLMPRKDPAAFAAMLAYADSCEWELAREIRDWLEKIADAPVVDGTQGHRNRREMLLRGIRGG